MLDNHIDSLKFQIFKLEFIWTTTRCFFEFHSKTSLVFALY